MRKESKQKVDDLLENFHTPLYNSNKMISFIFGAGINFNIAQGAKTWKGLAISEATKSFKKQGKDEFEAQALAVKLVESVGNDKLILGLESSVSISGIKKMTYPTKFATEFIRQLSSLMTKFNTYIGTLNYDKVLEEYLLIEGINRLEKGNNFKTVGKKDVVNHFHGMVDNLGIVSEYRLLTQNDYVFNSDVAAAALADFMEVNEENSGDKIHYVFILGANVNEDHILKTLNSVKNKGTNNSVRVVVFNHISGNKAIENKISEQFRELGIDFVDFYDSGNISSDFESLWKYLIDSLNTSSVNPGQINDMEIVDYMAIARDIIAHKTKDNLSIKDVEKYKFFKEYKGTENIEKYIAKTASFLTFRDDLKKNSFVKYLIEKDLPLSEYRHDLYKVILTRTDLMNLTRKYEGKVINLHSYRNEELMYVIKKTYESRGIINLKERPNFMTKLFINGFENKRYSGGKFREYVTKNFSVIDWKVFNNSSVRSADTPNNNVWLVELFEKNKIKFETVIDFSKNPSIKIYEQLIKTGSLWTFWLLETNKWKFFAIDNFEAIENMTLKYINSVDDGDFRYDSYNLFSYLYMKSNNKAYLGTMAKQSTFGEYPTTLNFIGHGGSFTSNYSEYDGKHFTGNIDYFETTADALELFNMNETIEYKDALRLAKISKSANQTWEEFIDDIASIYKIMKTKKYRYGFRKLFAHDFLIGDLDLKEYNKLSVHIKGLSGGTFGSRLFELETPKNIDEIEESINKIEWSDYEKVKEKDILNLFQYAEYKTANTWYADSYLYQTDFMKKMSFLSTNGNKEAKELMFRIYKDYGFSNGALYLMSDGFQIFKPESILDLNVILYYFPERALDFFHKPKELFEKIKRMEDFDKKNRDFIRFVWNYIFLAANNDWNVYSELSIMAAKISNEKNEFTNFFWEVHMHNFLQNNVRDVNSNPPAVRLVWLLRELDDSEFQKYDNNISALIKVMKVESVGVRGSNDVIHLIPNKPYGDKAKYELDIFIFKQLNLFPDEGIIEYYLKSTYEIIVNNNFGKSRSYFESRFPGLVKRFNGENIVK